MSNLPEGVAYAYSRAFDDMLRSENMNLVSPDTYLKGMNNFQKAIRDMAANITKSQDHVNERLREEFKLFTSNKEGQHNHEG